MDNFARTIETRLFPIMNRIANQRHLSAVRDGLIATIPITVIGSLFLLIPFIPWPQAYVDFMGNNPDLVAKLMIPFQMSLSLLSIYASFGIGLRLAQSYNFDGLSGGVASLFTFFITMSLSAFDTGSYLSVQYLGGEGVFTAILTAILAVEVMRFCEKHNIGIRLPDSVPANVSASFTTLVPISISVVVVWLLVHFLGFDVNALISSIVTPLFQASANSIITPLIYVILTCVMWLFGMHPAVLASIMTPIWTINAEANMAAAAAGQVIPNIGVQPFIFTFLWIGGGGGTLALCIFMMFAKSKLLKQLGRLSIVPSFFNINEPILFGLPIVMNPVLAIPFFIAPIICTFVTYFAFTTGLVPGMGYPLAAVWTVPSVFAGAIATASIRGSLLVLINFFIYAVIYYPFFKIYDRQMVRQEQEGELVQETQTEVHHIV